MAFLKVNTEEVAQMKEGAGGFISESGIYDLTIKNASVQTSQNGSTEVVFGFEDSNGNGITVYGTRITKNDGTPSFGMDVLKSLMIIAGLDTLSDPVDREVKIGDKTITLNVLEDLDGVEVKVRLQREFRIWNNNITDGAFKVRKFYSLEGLSGTEIAAGKTEATQLEKDSKYADKDKLKDGITQEEADAFLASKSKKGGSTTDTPAAPKPNPFAAN